MSKKKEYSKATTLRRFVGLLWEINKFYLIITVIGAILISVLPVVSSLLFSKIVTGVSNGMIESREGFFIGLVVCYSVALFIDGLIDSYFTAIIYFLFRYDMSKYMTERVARKLATIDIEFFENPKFTNLKTRALDSYEWRPGELLQMMFDALRAILSTVFALLAIAFTFPLASVLIVLSVSPGILIDKKFQNSLWDIWSADAETRMKYGHLLYLNNNFNNVKELRLLGIGGYLRGKLMDLITGIYNREKTARNKRTLYTSLATIPTFIVAGFLIYGMARNVSSSNLDIGILSFFVANLFTLKYWFGSALFNVNKVLNGVNYVSILFEFFDIENTIVSKPHALKDIETPPSIEFRNVSFKYPGTKENVFNNFSLMINKGQKVAIVGENGAGKTTMIKLLLRFYDVSDGEILINGVNIKDIDLESWRKHCGVLLQDFVTFHLPTVAENIGMGNIERYATSMTSSIENNDPKISFVPEEVLHSSQKAQANPFILKNELGFNAIVGRDFGGVDFSGGEKQRLALARTFYKDAGLVIMDESTSAVDAKAEAEIFESLKEYLSAKTVIFVSHRFSTVRTAERIIVVEHGNVIEDGSHETLMELGGVYKKLFTLQRKGYE